MHTYIYYIGDGDSGGFFFIIKTLGNCTTHRLGGSTAIDLCASQREPPPRSKIIIVVMILQRPDVAVAAKIIVEHLSRERI